MMISKVAIVSAVVVLSLWNLAAGAGPVPKDWKVDASLYPKAYGVLANEHLMFPVDMKDWAVKIDHTRQLFLDDYLIASRKRITRQVHAAKKHPGNPILRPDKTWEGRGCPFQFILRDPKTGKFQMWYAAHISHKLPSGVRVRFPTCYAESDDGIRWTKPVLNLFEFKGSKANNLVIPGGNPFGVFHEPQDPDPQRRYKAVVWHEPQYVPREGYWLYTSPDGIHWKRERREPIALSLSGYTLPQSGIGDTSLFYWDPRLKKYIGDVKFVLPGKMRTRGIMESDDLIHWTPPRMTLYPDGLDDSDSQIYGHLGFVYESMWIGMMRMMHTKRVKGSHKQTTIELTASRDGRHWTRVGKREEIIPFGKPAEWDSTYHDPCTTPILVNDELWIYYRSMPLWKDRRPSSGKSQIGLAMLRRDGFVSLNAGAEGGNVVTRPLTFQGKTLFINAEIADGGHIKAALQDASGKTLAPYSLAGCKPVTGDVLRAKVAWAEGQTISAAPGKSRRLVFELKKAKLYSFWIE